MTKICDYSKEIDEAINKYAKCSEDTKRDIRQSVWLVLLETNKLNIKKARSVIRKSVIQYIQEEQVNFKNLSMSEPSVFRTADETKAREFDISGGLIEDKAKDLIEKLPRHDRVILKMFFGLHNQEPQTLERIGWWIGKPEIYVRRRKKLALEKLKILLGET